MTTPRIILAAALCAAGAHAATLPASEDTTSAKGFTTKKTNAATTLTVNAEPSKNQKALLYFNLADVPTTDSSKILSARLRIYVVRVVDPGNLAVRRITSAWSEADAVTSAEPTIDAGTVATFTTASATLGGSKDFLSVDVTNTVKGWIAGTFPNEGLAIVGDAVANVTLGSKEGSGGGHPAQLEVELSDNALADGSVTDVKLADSSVTTVKFANNSVTSVKLASNLTLAGTSVFTGNIGIGTGATTPAGNLEIAAANPQLFLSAYGSAPLIIGRAAGGTLASPTAVTSGSALAQFGAQGHTGTAFSGTSGAMVVVASETFTNSANGTEIAFGTTPNGSTARAERLRITHDGLLRQGSGTATSEAPDKGLITRRIRSTQEFNGQILATDGIVQLQRDGTNGGLKIVVAAGEAAKKRDITAMGLDASGAIVKLVNVIDCNTAGTTVQVFTDAENVVGGTITFGNAFNGEDSTTVTFQRRNGDGFIIGTLTSTVNQ